MSKQKSQVVIEIILDHDDESIKEFILIDVDLLEYGRKNYSLFYGHNCHWEERLDTAIKRTWISSTAIDMFKKLNILTPLDKSKLGTLVSQREEDEE